jgi:antitoxin component YwqK of YwqJK toxin-antitoxin module
MDGWYYYFAFRFILSNIQNKWHPFVFYYLYHKYSFMHFTRKWAVMIMLAMLSIYVQAQTDTLFNQTDKQNFKQGWWKKNYPNGKLMYKGFFKDNKPVGEMVRYFENGAVKARLLYDNKGEYAHVVLLYNDGQVAATGVFYNSVKDSVWRYYSYYNHALTSEERFNKGKRQGDMLYFYNNGDVSEKVTWSDNVMDGPWEQYFPASVLKLKTRYVKGKLEGDFLVYYSSGKPYLKGLYKNGLREGLWTFYKEDGSKDLELNYHQGVTPDGDKLDARQQEFFKQIEENKGKFEEPDESNFLSPQKH